MNRSFHRFVPERQLVLALAFVVLAAGTSQAGFTTFASFGQDPAAITPTRDAFRAAVGGGTVAGGGTFASGSSDTVTATLNNGYKFASWTENGTVVSTAASYTFKLTGNRNLVANFHKHHQ